MALNRREFLKIMGGTAAAFAFPSVILQGCKKALQQATKRTPVIWIQAQSCSGCSVSLLNHFNPGIAAVLTGDDIRLNYHQTLMAGQGDVAVSVLFDTIEKKKKDFVLIVEGSVPTKNDEFCTIGRTKDGSKTVGAAEWIEKLGANALAVVNIGTCSAFGGIPAAKIRANGDNPTGAVSVTEFLKKKEIKTPVINVPGCPPHPDWMIGTLLLALKKGPNNLAADLDEFGRPKFIYGKTVHEQCEHLSEYKSGVFAKKWGEPGCLYNLGCLGMDSGCDIPTRKWVDGINSCTQCGAGCIGCTESVFPDYGTRGIFQHLVAKQEDLEKNIEHPRILDAVMNLKKGGVING